MKIISIIILSLAAIVGISTKLNAQGILLSTDSSGNSLDISGEWTGEIHLPVVKKQPAFPGGKKAWQDFLRRNINTAVPFANRAVPGTYTVMIRFIVGSNGKLWGIGADSNAGYGMEAEVIRCVKKSPEWIPAETPGGKKVSFTLRQLMTFTVKPTDVIVSF